MGNFDYKNICLQIKTRENFTDPRFVEFMRDWSFTEKEYDTFFTNIWNNNITNEYSKRIVDFFINYKEGELLPDKCDAYEPIKEKFNKDDISAPIGWLSFPAGSLLLKKRYKFNAEIENDYFAITFSEGKAVAPKIALPEYLGKITLWFSKQRKIDMTFLEQLLRDLCSYLNADNGIIFDQETNEVLLDIFQKG